MSRKYGFVLAVLASLILLLAGCGGQGGADTRTINASLGTWNYGGQNLGLAFIFWADLQAPTSPEGFQGTITGPSLSSPNPFGPVKSDFARAIYLWFPFGAVPVSGDHTITASPSPNQTLNRTLKLNASATLPQPQNVTVQVTANTATFSWSPVPGARSYYAQLWEVDQNGQLKTFKLGWYTKDTQVQFTQNAGISLSPGTYRARVFAFPLDFTLLLRPGQAAQLDPQFNISSALSQGVQVQSLGPLRVVPLPEPEVQPELGGGW
ncbi:MULTISPECIES: hypothetical protein [Thermus]|uniref:hypothetical protein n=1 Tax=Thermus TaxID=270 RepID=UPI001FAA121E|nr:MULTISPECIES: hypothetical protein [Thermus]